MENDGGGWTVNLSPRRSSPASTRARLGDLQIGLALQGETLLGQRERVHVSALTSETDRKYQVLWAGGTSMARRARRLPGLPIKSQRPTFFLNAIGEYSGDASDSSPTTTTIIHHRRQGQRRPPVSRLRQETERPDGGSPTAPTAG